MKIKQELKVFCLFVVVFFLLLLLFFVFVFFRNGLCFRILGFDLGLFCLNKDLLGLMFAKMNKTMSL